MESHITLTIKMTKTTASVDVSMWKIVFLLAAATSTSLDHQHHHNSSNVQAFVICHSQHHRRHRHVQDTTAVGMRKSLRQETRSKTTTESGRFDPIPRGIGSRSRSSVEYTRRKRLLHQLPAAPLSSSNLDDDDDNDDKNDFEPPQTDINGDADPYGRQRRQRRQEFFQINNITVSDLTAKGERPLSIQQHRPSISSSSLTLSPLSTSTASVRDVLTQIIMENRIKLRQNRFAVVSGLGLAFNSGYINGCCLSGVLGQSGAVAAFTGSYTMAGLAVGAGSINTLISIFKLIGSFILGSAVFGLILPTPKPGQLSTRYGPAFLIGSACMALSAITANLYPHQRTFLHLAAMANGLQNAATSSYTQNLVRTSHMSGITSDMGFLLGQMLRGDTKNVWRFVVLVGLSTSFLLGGVVSYHAVTKFKSMALVFNSVLYFVLALNIIGFTARQKNTSIWNVVTGRRSSTFSSSLQGAEPKLWQTSNSNILNMIQNNHKTESEKRTEGRPLATKAEIRWLISQYAKSTVGGSGSGMLSESDFASIIRHAGVKNASQKRIHDVFEQIDSDCNGFVGADELSRVLLTNEHFLRCDGAGDDDGQGDIKDDGDGATSGECTLVDPKDSDGNNMFLL